MVHADVWFDGASKGNPGPMAGSAVLQIGTRRMILHGRVGRGTNNEAEYQGLILGLEAARKAGASSVHVRGDSQLIIRQMEGRYAVKAASLRPLHVRAKELAAGFDAVQWEWIRREFNGDADQAANDALG